MYVPPYDAQEKHYPGMNFCGPGTNVTKRLANGVKPVDRLDKCCLQHDLVTEPRGPYTSNGDPKKLRKADAALRQCAIGLLAANYQPSWIALGVINAMNYLLVTGARGRK
jgi:hypothetical protein